MPKSFSLLQTLIALSLLTGCANHHAAVSDSHTDSASSSFSAIEKHKAKADYSSESITHYPTIQAGASSPGSQEFTLGNGQLTADIQQYAHEVAKTRQLPIALAEDLLKNARYNTRAARLMSPSSTRVRRSWQTYRNRFIEPVRLEAGLKFWQQYHTILDRVEKQTGVNAEIIVAIIGVETIYGRYMGNFRVLDALATLGFRYPDSSRPERSQMFRNQLADFILLHYQNKVDAYSAEGSFAGAMGLPQFMPSSLLYYAQDGDKDGIIDVHNSPADAILSVASFLRHHGWIPGLPVFAPVRLSAAAQQLGTGGLEPELSWESLSAQGAQALANQITKSWQLYPLGIVDLPEESKGSVEYRTGTPNFFAITHYNRSYFYASAVADLAKTLKARYSQTMPDQPASALNTPVDK